MKYSLWVIALLLSACSLEKTESEDTFEFNSTYAINGQVQSICEWKDGNYYISGFQTDLNFPKTYVASISRNGTLLWETIQVAGGFAIGGQILPASDGGSYVSTNYTSVGFQRLDANGAFTASAGTTASLPTIVPGQWNDGRSGVVVWNNRVWAAGGVGTGDASNIVLMNANPDGSDLNYSVLPSVFAKEDMECLQATNDGNFIIAGRRGGTGNLEYPILLKVSPQGNLIWRNDLPSTESGRANWIVRNADGSFLIGGDAGIPNVIGLSGQDVALWKVDANGNLIWQRTFGGALDQTASKILVTANGDYLICGQADNPASSSGEEVGMLMKVDANGQLLWTRLYPKADYLRGATATFDQGFLFAGKKANTVYLLKTDVNGDL